MKATIRDAKKGLKRKPAAKKTSTMKATLASASAGFKAKKKAKVKVADLYEELSDPKKSYQLSNVLSNFQDEDDIVESEDERERQERVIRKRRS